MNFTLLWIDGLLVWLLWVAALAACVARLRRRWVRGVLTPIVVGVPLLFLGSFVFATAVMKFSAGIEPDRFGYGLSLLLAYLVGASLILRRAHHREPGLMPDSATWALGSLGFAWLIAVVVGYMTLLNMDMAIRARSAILSVQIHSIYLATLPAITSDAQNAAPLYEEAFASLRDNREEQEVHNPPTGDRDDFDPDEPATIAFLDHHTATIALLRRAAAFPACRFDEDLLNSNITWMLPGLSEERNAASVLNLHAREEIARGQISSAIADAAAILGMSRHFGQRPLLISALVGIGIDALGNKTLEAALPAVKRADELNALRLDELPSMGRMFQQALRGEEAYGLIALSNMPPDQWNVANSAVIENTSLLSSSVGPAGAFFRVFFLDVDAYIKLLENLQNSTVQPYYKIRNQLPGPTPTKAGLFTSLLIPSLTRAFETTVRGQASDACARVAVAMTRFRLDHTSLPSRLEDLVPAYLNAIPIDPFDGHPLHLAIKNSQWIIYSIGPDDVDDGGSEIANGKGDVIFTLKPPVADATTRP